ncbi:MAG: riboflavin synthase [Gemmatimonadales bacterium]
MFTGIVDAVGRVTSVRRETGNGKRGRAGLTVTIRSPYRGVRSGESVAVNGACLTVERAMRGGFTVHVVETTLARTLFGEYATGRRVNLERAVRAMDRLGGHLVQGHVDGIGVVVRAGPQGDAWLLDLQVPPAVRRLALPLGSVTVDGVSLTVNALPDPDLVQVSLVPHTRRHTTLGERRAGERVHVEADVLAKYVKALCRLEP